MKIFVSKVIGCVAMVGWLMAGCSKEKPTPIDPHSPVGVNRSIQELQAPLAAALKTNDLPFIHKQMYYIEKVADSLAFEVQRDQKLSPEQKQRVGDLVVKLKHIAEETDNSSGRNQQDATEVNLQNLFAVSEELDAELAPRNKPK